MSNMSYCRFQNTDGDLRDCERVLEEVFGGDDEYGDPSEEKLVGEELEAAKRLIARCGAIVSLVNQFVEQSDDKSLAKITRDGPDLDYFGEENLGSALDYALARNKANMDDCISHPD